MNRYLSHPGKLLIDHIDRIAAFRSEDDLFVRVARFHDLGKVQEGFQAYIRDPQNYKGPKENHSAAGALAFFLCQEGLQTPIQKEPIFGFLAIWSHHGKLKDLDDLLLFFGDRLRDTAGQLQRVLQKPECVDYFGLQEIEPTFEDERAFKRFGFYVGKLRFGIDDYVAQKQLFSELIYADKHEAITHESPKAPIATLPLESLTAYLGTLKPHPQRNEARKRILEAYEAAGPQPVYTLTAPTGIGKTLISLELALRIRQQTGKDRIVYALPFTSIIDQTAAQFEGLYPGEITIHHHRAELKAEEGEYADENERYDRAKFLTHSWSDAFVVTTFYQLFFALFSNENSENIKFQALKKSVVVLDEVQAIPHDLWQPLKAILSVLARKMDMTLILMSATMPVVVNEAEALELAPKEHLFGDKNRYRLELIDLPDNREEKLARLADTIVGLHAGGSASVLCVVNTIRNCKLLFEMVSERIGKEAYCLNSYMLMEDRQRIIAVLREPDSNRVCGKVLISTQVIEAGVDLDFDTGIREAAPLSSIIQTAGRINREGLREQAVLRVFSALYSPYDKMLDLKTEKVLLNALAVEPIEERAILAFVERYFRDLDGSLDDRHGVLGAIERFKFSEIDKALKESFGGGEQQTKSVAIGVDLKDYERVIFETEVKTPYAQKAVKERLFRQFQNRIVNIKKRDLDRCGFAYEESDLFGIGYFVPAVAASIYSDKSGFLLEEEKGLGWIGLSMS